MKILKKILYFVLLFVGFLGFIVADVFFIQKSFATEIDVAAGICCCVFGCLITLYLAVVLHEVGHLIFGLAAGMRFVSISFPFVSFYRINGKIRIGRNKDKSFFGSCEMFPKSSNNPAKSFAVQALGGPVGSLIALLFSASLLFLGGKVNGYVSCFFGTAAPLLFVIFLDNAYPMTAGFARTDGRQFADYINNDNSFKVLSAVLAAQGYYNEGVSPRNLPSDLLCGLPQLPEDDFNYAYYLNNLYLHFLDLRDYEGVINVHARILGITEYLPDLIRDPLICDLFFDSLFILPDKNFVSDNKDVVFNYLNAHDDLYASRIRGYYYLYKKDYFALSAEIAKAKKTYLDYPLKGIAEMEMRLIAELEQKAAEINP